MAWFAVALVGAARAGRGFIGIDDEAERASYPFARVFVGLSVLSGGGWLLGEGLRTVVRHLGVSQALLGNTALAATVESEELARVAVPTRRGRPELALGNLAGTIIHFAALNAGGIALVKPLSLGDQTTGFYLPAAAASAAILAALLATRRTLGRIEGAALVSLYVIFVVAAVAI